MKLMTTVVALAIFSSAAIGAETKYALTGTNTSIEWTGTKPVGKHNGGFKKLKGAAIVGDDGLTEVSVDIDCDSLHSDDGKLTKHLKSADFFSVKEHKNATFKSTKIEKAGKGYTVTGDMTLLGNTKEINFPAEITTDGKLVLKAEFKINRTDFGMTFGKGMVDDMVTIRVKVDAKPPKSTSPGK